MGALGINVAGRAQQKPADIAALGATWARCVAYPDTNLRAWMQDCHARNIKVLLVLASESIGTDWQRGIALFRDRYGLLVDAWQVGNESDHESPSSWTLGTTAVTNLLRLARSELGLDARIIGPGLVSGNPGWAAGVDWSPVDALAVHPYARWPDTQDLADLLDAYAAYGKPLWVTEYDARTVGMAAYLRDYPSVDAALGFCMSDSMVPGFGLLENPIALDDFKAATQQSSSPAEQHAAFQLGFLDWSKKDPALLGTPLENERGGVPGFSVQKTSTGRLMACNLVGRGWTMTLWRDSDGSRWLYQDGRSVQIA